VRTIQNDNRLIIQPSIARKLLKLGYQIIDLKPQRQTDGSVDYTRTVFLFAYKDGIDKSIQDIQVGRKIIRFNLLI